MSKLIVSACIALAACSLSPNPQNTLVTGGNPKETVATANPGNTLPSPSVILGRKEVPILCYHQIRDWKPTDSRTAKDY
ncbi:MAG TPA: hypothetical protein VHC48_24900, partial [Puia sp.]|nr:hypothetical protein [Puia sp.]